MKNDPNLMTEDGIKAWIEQHQPDGLQKLVTELNAGRITGAKAANVRDWVNRQGAIAAAEAESAKVQREERAVQAAEESADAAKDSAKAAKWSIWISILALLVAVIALFVGK